jgi:hydroxymethylpyrimidine/phosphomethylpyrimidine kinase
MLFDSAITSTVSRTLKEHYDGKIMPPLVIDPVCVSTSGHTLLQPDAVEVMIKELFPLSTLITPNKSEAELLLSHRNLPSKIESLEEMLRAAKDLLTTGTKAVLLKGGHITATFGDIERISDSYPRVRIVRDGLLDENMRILQIGQDLSSIQLVVDLLQEDGGAVSMFVRPRIDSRNTHGTGCTLSAALACELGRGASCLFGSIPFTLAEKLIVFLQYLMLLGWPLPIRTRVLKPLNRWGRATALSIICIQ